MSRYWIHIQVLRAFWAAVFVALVAVPLLLSARAGGRGGLALELSLTLGLVAMSLLITVIVLPSRVRSISEAFGIERVLRSHKLMGVWATVLVIVHLVFVVIDKPANLILLNFTTAPPRAVAAGAATYSMVLLCVLSFARKKLNTSYEVWRTSHVILALGAAIGTGLHVYFLNHLTKDWGVRVTFAALALGVLGVLVNRWVARPLNALGRAYVIQEVIQETPSSSTLVLRPMRAGQQVMRFRPGQFAWLRFDTPLGKRESHPFSIASSALRPRRLEFSIRHAGDWTDQVARLRPGRRVYVDGPHGAFSADQSQAREILLLASGVGITPMMSMLRSAAHRGDDRLHHLVVGSRSETELMFREELAWLQQRMRLVVTEVVSRPSPNWTGQVGRVDRDLLSTVLPTARDAARMEAYICGPPAMVESASEALEELGMPAARVHTEQFDMV